MQFVIKYYHRLRVTTMDKYPMIYRFASICKRVVMLRHNVCLSILVAFNSKYIILYWCESRNFGDALSPVLVATLSGKRVVNAYGIINIFGKPVFSVVGSVLEYASDNKKNIVVWGSGFLEKSGKLRNKPSEVLAVRGPLSRKKLLEHGVECPETYGDPALLCPLLYKPIVSKKHRLGIIPHYLDKKNPVIDKFRTVKGIAIIDVESSIKDVINCINECEVIASSSLHGLIIADAYEIPIVWLKISEILTGGEFKFTDYFLSVNKVMQPLTIDDSTTLEQILSAQNGSKVRIDLNALLEACPFLRGDKLIYSDIEYIKDAFIKNLSLYHYCPNV
ncbi:MAG: polysaccharide pyruvyl transferase family protein [Planctomycetes bacterium]|nr:polysaccharide pyruvyl transferase family protein [Planctomycetota bacterium]